MAQLADYSLSHRITPEGATMKTLGPNPEAAVLPCRGFQALLCGLLLAAGTGCRESVPQGTGGDGAELKWARKVAESFLKALTVDNGKTAYGLLGTDYRERLPEDQRTGKYWVRPNLSGRSYLGRSTARNWPLTGLRSCFRVGFGCATSLRESGSIPFS